MIDIIPSVASNHSAIIFKLRSTYEGNGIRTITPRTITPRTITPGQIPPGQLPP